MTKDLSKEELIKEIQASVNAENKAREQCMTKIKHVQGDLPSGLYNMLFASQ